MGILRMFNEHVFLMCLTGWAWFLGCIYDMITELSATILISTAGAASFSKI